jgi:copper chaperone
MEPNLEATTLQIRGMTCAGCVRSVTRALQKLNGVASAEVSLDGGEARVVFDPTRVSVAQLEAALELAGYQTS